MQKRRGKRPAPVSTDNDDSKTQDSSTDSKTSEEQASKKHKKANIEEDE
jgi:hypothetical protein